MIVAANRPDDSVRDDVPERPPGRTPARRAARALVMYVLPFLVLAAAAGGAVRLHQTGPKARQRPARQTSTLVQVGPVKRTTHRAIVRVMGTVVAAQEVVLQPQVSGAIVEQSPELTPGGYVKAGDVVVRIDPAEYRAVLARAEAELAGKQTELQSATWELARLEGLERQDAANKKEMDDARTAKGAAAAAVAAARASVDQARLDVERTTIRAPFNGIVSSKNVDLGAQVTPQTQLATLVGTDEYWVEVCVPVERLSWITIPDKSGGYGSPAVVQQSAGVHPEALWNGRVSRLCADLETQGRMARALVTVSDPLGLETPSAKRVPLLIGSYVHVDIEGRELRDVVAIPRSALRDGQRVWLMSERGELEIRDVDIVWRDRDTVFVGNGVTEGERIVMSDIAAPVEGMALRELRAEGDADTGNRVACKAQ